MPKYAEAAVLPRECLFLPFPQTAPAKDCAPLSGISSHWVKRHINTSVREPLRYVQTARELTRAHKHESRQLPALFQSLKPWTQGNIMPTLARAANRPPNKRSSRTTLIPTRQKGVREASHAPFLASMERCRKIHHQEMPAKHCPSFNQHRNAAHKQLPLAT